jgi:hypothetical protein
MKTLLTLLIASLIITFYVLMGVAKKQRRRYGEIKQRIKDRAFRRDE